MDCKEGSVSRTFFAAEIREVLKICIDRWGVDKFVHVGEEEGPSCFIPLNGKDDVDVVDNETGGVLRNCSRIYVMDGWVVLANETDELRFKLELPERKSGFEDADLRAWIEGKITIRRQRRNSGVELIYSIKNALDNVNTDDI